MQTLNARILTVAVLAAGALNGQTTSFVAGTVLENGALPLAGATVSYMGSGRIEKDSHGHTRYLPPQIIGNVRTQADGTFLIAGLPPDRYTICAGGTLPVHISSCVWNTSEHRVVLASGQNVGGLKLSVTRGALLDIEIADSTGCAAKYNKAPVYVFAGSLSVQAYPVAANVGVYHYRALVPQMTPLRVSANHRCSFADVAGNNLSGPGLSILGLQAESASVTMTAR